MKLLDKYLAVADICSVYAVRRSYVYKLASVHRWRRVKEGIGVKYHIDDVDKVLGRDAE